MPAATAIAMSSSVAMIGEIAFLEVNRTLESESGRLYNESEQLLQFGSADLRVVAGELGSNSADNPFRLKQSFYWVGVTSMNEPAFRVSALVVPEFVEPYSMRRVVAMEPTFIVPHRMSDWATAGTVA